MPSNAPQIYGNEYFQVIYPSTVQQIAVGSSSVSGVTFGTGVGVIRVVSNVECYFKIATGTAALATSSTGIYLPAYVPEYFGVLPGQTIAFKQVGSAGTAHVLEAAAQ